MPRTVNEIRGNVSNDLKEAMLHCHNIAGFKPDRFANAITGRMELISIDLFGDSESNKEAVIVGEIGVTEDMCNHYQILHGGCAATIIDYTTSLAIPVRRREDKWRSSGVTLSLNVVYFLPARIGDTLRITATTKASGKRAVTVYCEVLGPMGLTASATHIKMLPKVNSKIPPK